MSSSGPANSPIENRPETPRASGPARYFVLLGYCVPLLLFCMFFTRSILDPNHVAWLLRDDWGQHFLGWHAFRHTPLKWPFNREYLLAHPTGLSLIYTDSNPILAMPLRLVSRFLSPAFQFIGLWFLLCLVLHFHVAYKLVKSRAPGIWSALAGATLLTLLPTLYNRIRHDTLMAHWIILWALYIFFNVKSERRKNIGYALTLVVAALIHPYILFAVFFIWGADLFRIAIPLIKAKRWPDLVRPAAIVTGTFALVILALAIVGTFDASGASGGGYGTKNMSLDAPFNPVRAGFALSPFGGGRYANQSYEGFQYLGFGLLLLIGFAAYIYWRWPRTGNKTTLLAEASPLKWPFILLTLLAISNRIQIGGFTLLRIPLPPVLNGLLSIVRASGRLFWPVAYTAVFLALIVLYRQGGRIMTWILALAIILQVADMAPFSAQVRSLTANTSANAITQSEKWDTLVSHADKVFFEPPSAAATGAHETPFYEITYRAVSRNIPVNTMYAARDNQKQLDLELNENIAFTKGAVNPKSLYILISGCPAPRGYEGRLRTLDGIWFIPPEVDANIVTTVPQPTVYRLGTTYDIKEGAQITCQLDENWARPETTWTWSEGSESSLTLPLHLPEPRDLTLSFSAGTFANKTPVHILVNGTELARLELNRERAAYTVPVARQYVKSDAITVTFKVDPLPDGVRKQKRDGRLTGIQLYTISLN